MEIGLIFMQPNVFIGVFYLFFIISQRRQQEDRPYTINTFISPQAVVPSVCRAMQTPLRLKGHACVILSLDQIEIEGRKTTMM